MIITFILYGETYSISREDVLAVACSEEPDRLAGYYVEIHGKRFPPTQLVHQGAQTRSRPHSHNSRSILSRLGFTVTSVDQNLITNNQSQTRTEFVTADTLSRWRRNLLRILDHLDGRITGVGPAGRIGRLVEGRIVPRTIASHMRVVLEHRNAAEYENAQPTEIEGEAVQSSWNAILTWARSQRINV